MKNWILLLTLITTFLAGCGQGQRADTTAANSKNLTCLILGYDSIIYYTGTSQQMEDVHKGHITDSAFVNAMFKKIKDGGLSMTFKPGGGADIAGDLKQMVNLANNYEVERRSIDSGDANEEKAFGFVTPPVVKSAMRGEDQAPLKLFLPREERDTANPLPKFPRASQLVIILSGSNDIYAYMGTDMEKGKKYTTQQVTDLLIEKKSDKKFSVIIKAASNASYRNTVDMLDVMSIAGIKNYALVDITKKEEDYLHRIY